MKVDGKIRKRLDELVKLGQEILDTGHPGSYSPPEQTRDPRTWGLPSSNPQSFYTAGSIDKQLATQWVTSSLNLLSRVFGKSSIHYQKFNQYCHHINRSDISQALGVLQAAKDDYENGALFDIKILIEADLFDDFLEQADHLLQKEYYQPAAVIIGCVLEDGLRKLCDKHEISLPDRPWLDGMNIDLAKEGIYNKSVQKQITFFAGLRNDAAHGNWNEFDKTNIEAMLKGVRDFMETHFI
ncbi:MAG: DUF4145 domain-containing protein [Candidatus Poribacteria bacterium]|nr:DUF4145 domain-containing protein [Candidatus Poribacteria bacterium]